MEKEMETEVANYDAAVQEAKFGVMENGDEEKPFVHRVVSYPVIASTLTKTWELYSKAKESHDLVKYSLETAESGVKYVSSSVAPVVTKLERPLSAVNSMACSGLDVVEEKCPIITKPTDEVVAETKNLYDTTVKPSVDKVASIGQYATEKVNGITAYGTETITMVRDTSYEKVAMACDMSIEKLNMVKDKSYDTMNAALASQTGQRVLDKIDNALTVAEDYVDQYLPEYQDENREKRLETPTEPIEMDEAKAKTRPVVIYDKAKQRLYSTAMRKIQDVQVRSKETLERLNFTVNLIDYAKNNMQAVNDRMTSSVEAARNKGNFWWDEITKEEKKVDKENGDEEIEKETQVATPVTMEMQVLSVARNLTQKLRQSLHSLNEKSIPEHLRDRYTSARQYSTELVTYFYHASRIEDLSDQVMTKAHEKSAYIQDTMSKLADLAVDNWPLNQAVQDFEINELSNTDDEMDDLSPEETKVE